jgi:hypothetical protein
MVCDGASVAVLKTKKQLKESILIQEKDEEEKGRKIRQRRHKNIKETR